MSEKQTFKESGYKYKKYLGDKTHLLESPEGRLEVWVSNKNHASYGLIYKNTHLEFAREQKALTSEFCPECETKITEGIAILGGWRYNCPKCGTEIEITEEIK